MPITSGFQAFKENRFQKRTMDIILKAKAIIDEYYDKGYTLTLRQVYYQLVARDYIKNNDREYQNLSYQLSEARLSGLVSWDAIEDRTRFLRKQSTWDKPGDIIANAANQFQHDLWATQKLRLEVWVEKDALAGIIGQAANKYRVPFYSCRGYNSQTAAYDASVRALHWEDKGQRLVVLHFGDHDPSGLDMTRDIADRFQLFAPDSAEIRRLALTMAQVKEFDPPPNPAKLSDIRATGYIAEFGEYSWELDALPPEYLDELISGAIEAELDKKAWDDAEKIEAEEISQLKKSSRMWDKVAAYVTKLKEPKPKKVKIKKIPVAQVKQTARNLYATFRNYESAFNAHSAETVNPLLEGDHYHAEAMRIRLQKEESERKLVAARQEWLGFAAQNARIADLIKREYERITKGKKPRVRSVTREATAKTKPSSKKATKKPAAKKKPAPKGKKA